MAKRLKEFVKYTTKELDSYTNTEGSCVQKVNANLHLSIGPYALADFKNAILQHLMRTKIGLYNLQLEGIVLDIKNIKLLGKSGALRFDDPKVHVDINADCYLFRPVAGAVLSGRVKHISTKHVGAIIYRVFNANIKFCNMLVDDDVEMNKEVKFRIIDFNMLNVFPYIKGELLSKSKFQREEYVKKENSVDSGFEEKESMNELDGLLEAIKEETVTGSEEVINKKKNKATKRKHTTSASDIVSLDESSDSKKKSAKKTKRDLDESLMKLDESSDSKKKSSKKAKKNLEYDISIKEEEVSSS